VTAITAQPDSPALARFSPVARAWFTSAFPAPTPAQELGWEAIASGDHTLLLAPTGSGKTLAAFLWCLDQLIQRAPGHAVIAGRRGRPRRAGVSVLYVSPLKALSYDVERNLRAPLAGLRIAAAREGLDPPDITVATRTGDTPAREREDIRRDPPDILITTPESLYLLLTSRSRDILRTVGTVIVDEIHTMAGSKRGAHLSLSLERLEALTGRPFQRIGLSATQRPLDEVARYLGGDRPVRIADAGASRPLDLKVIVPVEDMASLSGGDGAGVPPEAAAGPEARTSIWPSIYPKLLELVRAHRSTLIFVNNRRLAERIALRVNELAGEELLRAHHGSVAREQRIAIEERLKAGLLPGLVCTSSLELGIDMGAVDLVVQVESPKSVARGLQRVGRAGHQVNATSIGRIFPKFRGDLLECAVVVERMQKGLIEATAVPRNPLDVLAQQVVAMCSVDEWTVDALERIVRRSYNFANLSRDALESVLGMLAGAYPSDEFADLKPRLIWDRERNTLAARSDARTVAIVNAGTIPDRGLYGVFLGEGGPRVGELDEEMVYESRPGEVFLLGATSWRIEQITRDRVIVSPAPGEPGKMPFWRGDGVGRPLELGRAIGAFTRELDSLSPEAALTVLQQDHDLDELAAQNLLAYLADEKAATGALPTDRTIVIERFRDELGDWRIVILTPFGGRVHAPWAQAIEALLVDRAGFDVQTLWSDDGIAIRFAGGDDLPPTDLLVPSPEEAEELVVNRLAGTPLFAAHFRENAGRALLLPKRRPGARSPLWLQRQRAANLLAVASRYGSFPIVLETYRECLRDVFDLPGLQDILARIRSREIRLVPVETVDASPFARSLLFDYIAAYMYEGDAPLAERRAQALALDRTLLRDLLGDDEFRELLDPEALADLELELQCLTASRRARTADQLHDLLRRLGDLSFSELEARAADPAALRDWLSVLQASHRAVPVRIAGSERWIAIEDAGRYRDALGVAPPLGVPEAFLRPTGDALQGLTARFARTHAPFLARDLAGRWEIPESLARLALASLERSGMVLHGDFRPGGHEREWCDPEVLRQLRRRSLARLRRDVEPIPPEGFARFLLAWHGFGSTADPAIRIREVVAQLEGYPIPVSVLEREVLPPRIPGYQPRLLDELGAAGEIVWVGRGALGGDDGRVALYLREHLDRALPTAVVDPDDTLGQEVLALLRARGASFFTDIAREVQGSVRDILAALWRLAWAGLITNDTFAPLRAFAWPKRAGGYRARPGTVSLPPEASGRWWALPLADGGRAPMSAAHALATTLLERYGVVFRDAAQAEGLPGGFSAVYPVLKAMEESGRIRRGYFVEGRGGAQFALPGAVERLRAERDRPQEPRAAVLAATDPANPYGAVLPFPRRDGDGRRPLARTAGARVVLVDGFAVLYIERAGKGVVTLDPFDDESLAAPAVDALVAGLPPARPFTIERIDGGPAASSSHAARFLAAGFVAGYRGLVYQPPREVPRARGR
jgi:ATP-dependent Lhr-like helicase